MIGLIEKVSSMDNRPKKAQTVPASLFWKDEQLGINGFPFDLFISEKHQLNFRISEHPLQNGSTIADHVHKELQTVTIEGMFTNHPLKKSYEVNEVTFKDEFATKEEKATLTNRALKKFTELEELANKRTPVRLVCSLKTYPKMIITRIDYERNAKSGSSIRFTMELREIQIVNLQASQSESYDMLASYLGQIELNKKLSEEAKKERKKNAIMTAKQKNIGKKTAIEISPKDLKEVTKYLKALDIRIQ